MAAGLTSVMLDFSSKSLDQNIRGMQEAVQIAGHRGITVEGEIGKVGRNSDETVEGSEGSALTDPDQAAAFCGADPGRHGRGLDRERAWSLPEAAEIRL